MDRHTPSPEPFNNDDDAAPDVATAKRIVGEDRAARVARVRAEQAERTAKRQAEREGASAETAAMMRERARGVASLDSLAGLFVSSLDRLTLTIGRAIDGRGNADDQRSTIKSLRDRIAVLEQQMSERTTTTTKKKNS